jgi:signal transduction histidine kinase/DNA-binding response OmpR family regulator
MKAGRILVVDDDDYILELLQMRLEAMGLDVTAARSRQAAVRALEVQLFDVALFDLRMEPVNGLELMEDARVRQPGLPVLIMTAHGTIDNAVEAVRRGAFDYLTKPFVTEELKGKLSRALSARRWARDRNLLRAIGEMLASSGTPERILEAVAWATVEATDAQCAVVFLQEGTALTAKASAGAPRNPIESLVPAARAAIDGKAPTTLTAEDAKITLAAPLLVEGGAAGALVVQSPGGVAPTDEELELLAVLSSQAAVALRNAHELARLRSGALAALGRMATEVAHELRNPLGGLKLYGRHLERRLDEIGEDEGLRVARKICQAIDHLADLVTDITGFASARELRREPTRLSALLDDCLALAQDRVASKNIRLVREAPDGMPLVHADPRELRKVFLNLILNGVDAMELGGTLTVGEELLDGGLVRVTVADTGSGMSAEVRARIFDPFFTTKANGTGLGMSIARSVVHLHGGSLEIDSEPGRGTRVSVRLPIGAP